ncbi:hypothetical protein CR513_37229, partial [Mucuna pruriens]
MEVSNLAAKLKSLKLELDEDLIMHLRDKTESSHFASSSHNKKRKNIKGATEGSSKGKKPKENEEFTCFFCKKSGHMKKQCSKYAKSHVKK